MDRPALTRGLIALALALLAPLALGPLVDVLPVARAAESTTVDVELRDAGCPAGPDRFCIVPARISVADGFDLELRVVNNGTVAHNLTFAVGTASAVAQHGMNRTLEPNGTAVVRVPWADLEEALGEEAGIAIELRCGVPHHASLGETAVLQVGSADEEGSDPVPGPGALVVVGAVGLVASLAGSWKGRRPR